MSYKIGVDGGGTKTECVLVDASGEVVARYIGAGSNPSIVGNAQARQTVTEALGALRGRLAPERRRESPEATMLCMAGSPGFWQDYASGLSDFGRVSAYDDSLPVLELATDGGAGLVLHAGTGSFVAARADDGSVHYAGGLGWRFGDSGSGYDVGRRAVGRALLEMQGWAPPTRLSAVVRDHTGLTEWAMIERRYYGDPAPQAHIAALAPAVLDLAANGDPTARALALDSAAELLDLARDVAAKLFPAIPLNKVRAGLSGPILAHPVVRSALATRAPFPLIPIEEPPVEGVRRLLARLT